MGIASVPKNEPKGDLQQAVNKEPSGSSAPSAEKLRQSKKSVIAALLENTDIALGRKPVKVTQLDRKTGKIVTFEQTDRDGIVAVRNLELLGNALGLFDGRLGDEDDKLRPIMTRAAFVAYARAMIRDWDAEHGMPSADGAFDPGAPSTSENDEPQEN
jgi:hypothetical protein